MNIEQLFEGFSDGVLVLTDQGELLYANAHAYIVCELLRSVPNGMPKPLWQICQAIADLGGCVLHPEPLPLKEGEFLIGAAGQIRVRVHHLRVEDIESLCWLIVLENREESWRAAAIADAQSYHLTPREAEVWQLRRAGCSYSEIAQQLFITRDTVKKHLKSIHAKREMFQG